MDNQWDRIIEKQEGLITALQPKAGKDMLQTAGMSQLLRPCMTVRRKGI